VGHSDGREVGASEGVHRVVANLHNESTREMVTSTGWYRRDPNLAISSAKQKQSPKTKLVARIGSLGHRGNDVAALVEREKERRCWQIDDAVSKLKAGSSDRAMEQKHDSSQPDPTRPER
jgi:hypothetical protein